MKTLTLLVFSLFFATTVLASPVGRLHEDIVAQGIPITGVSYDGVSATINFHPSATPAQIIQANAMAAAHDWSEATDITLSNRKRAASDADDITPVGVRIRALIEVISKRDNYLVNRIVELQDALTAVRAAGGNANSRIDNLPTSWMPTNNRNKAATLQEYKDDINAGNQDT